MAKRGPQPKPIEQKRREGGEVRLKGLRTRQIPDPLLVGGRAISMRMPDDLSEDEAAAWLSVVPQLERSGLLDVVDEVSLANLVLVVAAVRGARAELARDGWYVASPNGYRIAHPAVGVLRQFLAEFRQWSNLFGLDPASRAGLVGAGVKSPAVDEDDAPARPTLLRSAP